MSGIFVSGLNVYPIKSCGSIAISSAAIETWGVRYDRRWMIVDAEGRFMTQRVFPRLSLVRVTIEKDSLVVTAPSMDLLRLPIELTGSQLREVAIWDDHTQALVADSDAGGWFSRFLETPCQPVYMPEDSLRPVNPKYSGTSHTSFSDGFPFLLTSEESLLDLNARFSTPLPMNRFRPNIVVRGCAPFDEDSWKSIRIAGVRFDVAKPCARCVTTTVDQATGEAGKEPLHTLSLYRSRNGKVLFGQNLIHDGTGTLKIGDPVTIETTKHSD